MIGHGAAARAFEVLVRVDRRTLVGVSAMTVVVMAVATVVSLSVGHEHPWLGLDSEHAFRLPVQQSTIALPAVWSGLLLAGAALGWLVVASKWPGRSGAWLPAALGVFLLFVALDDNLFVHERLEYRLGVDWMTLYAPMIALMAGVVLVLLHRLRHIDLWAAVMLAAGCALAGLAQLLEWLQWDGDEPAANYVLMMVPEELAETFGALLIGLAAISAAKALRSTGLLVGSDERRA